MAITQKRPLDDSVFSTKHIVMDIEGTTTSISFVKDTLFPYVRENLDVYLSSHWNEEEFKGVLNLLKDQAAEDKKADVEGAVEIPSDGSDDDVKAAVAKNVLWQMDSDRKTTALKKLQGHMWRQGYKSGELKGHLFADVAPALKEWVKDGRKLYVYSSGSVEAQKLLFGNSAAGDLTELFTDFFDTEVGAKVDVESYKSIVKKLGCNADDVLFLTDLPKEASAAREAGLPVILVEREGNEPLANELKKEFSAVSSFQDLAFESSSKKPKVIEAEAMDVDSQVDEATKSVQVSTEAKGKKETQEADKEDEADSKDEVVKKEESSETSEESTKEETMETETPDTVSEKSSKVEDGKEVADPATDVKPKDVKTEEETSKMDVVLEAETKDLKKTEEIPEQKTVKSDSNSESVKEDKTDDEKKPEPVVEVEVAAEAKTVNNVAEKLESESEEKSSEVEHKEEIVEESKVVEKSEEMIEQSPAVEEAKEIVDESKVVDEKQEKIADPEPSKSGNVAGDTKVVEGPQETDEHKSENDSEKKPVSEQAEDKEKSNTEVTNGTVNVEEVKEKLNGSTNGTSNGAPHEGKKSEENGTVENGHKKVEEDEIPEIIVAKSAPQIEGGNADAVAKA